MRNREESSERKTGPAWAFSALTCMALSQALFPSFWQNVNSFYTSELPLQVQIPSPKEVKRSDEKLGTDGLYDDHTQVYLVRDAEEFNDFQ